MKMLAPVLFLALSAAGIAVADEPLSDSQAQSLLTKYNCQSCHAMGGGSAGPSWRAIASKYSSDPNAIDELSIMVTNGSSGEFGDSAMSGYDVPAGDLRAMINWILQLQL